MEACQSTATSPKLQPGKSTLRGAMIVFALMLAGLWLEARAMGIAQRLGASAFPVFACFGLLLGPLWFFGFGADQYLRERLSTRAARTLAPGLLMLPYLLSSVPQHEFHLRYALALALLPVGLAALLETSAERIHAQRLLWQDGLVLAVLALTLELRLLSGAWPHAGLGSLPKLYLADVALYLYLIVRNIEGMGYSFQPRWSAFLIGLREWSLFAPIAIGVGLALHFIRFYPRIHSVAHIAAGLVVTFLLTAVPEEIFFRGILQNLLESNVGRGKALAITALLFGLAHFPKGAVFNWRYVILAAIAGVFYGRAWRAKRQLLASATTHTLIDVVWSLWFR